MRKTFVICFVVIFLIQVLPVQIFALAGNIVNAESYPGKMDVKNVNGLGKNISTDYFGGAMTFQYPLSFPVGSRGVTPELTLSYASNNTDAFSPYGYGFSLSLGRIQRSAKKGVSELYVSDEYAAFGSDLIKLEGASNTYRSKNGSDNNLYTKSGSSWMVRTPDGKELLFGGGTSSRIVDPLVPEKIYAWLIDEERDVFGHSIRYNYIIDKGQVYISDISYGYDANDQNPIYQIHFDYIDKSTSLTSYRTQFEVSTKKLLSRVTLSVNQVAQRSYVLKYDDPDAPISHLLSIGEEAGSNMLPKIQFGYGVSQFQHLIMSMDNNRGGKAMFEYAPSTGYRDGSGELLNNRLPFMVMTLSKQIFEDTVTGLKSEESYSYSGGHYYYDATDLWGREYVGFAQVSLTDDKTRKILYFHQSQTAPSDPMKYNDHISKKGRIYKTDIVEKSSGKILQQELVKYDSRVLFGERRLVYPAQKIQAEFATDGTHRDIATTYQYDDQGNLIEEARLGLVSADLTSGTWTDIPGDTITMKFGYTSNTQKNLYNFKNSEKIYGFSGELLAASLIEYDDTASGVTLGLVTAKKRKDIQTDQDIITQRTIYSSAGMPIEQYDAMDNKTILSYDVRDIALSSSVNPLGWVTTYTYDYTVGKPTKVTNQNNVTSTTSYDPFGRVVEVRQNSGDGDILLARNNYDDIHIPNSMTNRQYFDTEATDSKTTKSYMDGWGRTIATTSTTEKPGQYTVSQVRYDDDGNPIYAGYPVFVGSDEFDASLVLRGVTDGEIYRSQKSGVSYQYDALDRIVSQRDARGVTTKSYAPGKEIITNALGYNTEARYDAYSNLISYIEKIDNRDIITRYDYNPLGRPVRLTDAYGNIRTWSYDGLGRLISATDIHAPGDTTYGARTYSYDTLDRVKTYTNANNETITYSYDTLARITHEFGPNLDRTYLYDAGTRSLGTLSSVSDTGSTVSFIYDPLGRKTGETRTIGDRAYTLGYSYNPASILTDISYPDGGHTKYVYRNGFIEGVTYTTPENQFTQIISDISYAPNSTMRSIRYGNGVVKNTERDVNNNYRLMGATATTPDGTKILDTNYSYDAIGNITHISENGIEPLKKSIDYTYDPVARLTSANYVYSVAGYGRDQTKNLTYTYDDIGNIMSATDVGSYSYAGTDFANPHAVTTAGDMTYSYDQAGNTVTRNHNTENLSFTYSSYGELLSSLKDDTTTTYVYDHTRRRIVKSTLGLTEHHIIDGYEVEYESGALIPVSGDQLIMDITGTTDTGSILIESGVIDGTAGGSMSGSSLVQSGSVSTGSTESVVITESGSTGGTGETLTGSSLSSTTDSGAILTDTGLTNTGLTSTESLPTSSGGMSTDPATGTGESISGALADSGAYMVIASYYAASQSGATPITLTTTLTHIYLGEEKIATFQSQTDDTPKTLDDDRFVFHISDHLNSSSLDLSSTGAILQATDYQPFGKTITYQVTHQRVKGKKGGYKNKYLFANKQLDEETDLQYFEKRYYDPRIGRFTTEDPVFWEVGFTKRPSQYFTDPEQWNTYSYVRNNPLNLVDPTGEVAIAVPILAALFEYQSVTVTITCSTTCSTIITGVLVGGGTYVMAQYTESNFYKSMEKLGDYIYELTHKTEANETDVPASGTDSSPSGTPPNNGNKDKKDKQDNTDKKKPSVTDKKVGDQIPGRLKTSPSYHTAYAEKTINQLTQLAKQGDQKAKQMLKLAKDTARLMEKLGAKSKK